MNLEALQKDLKEKTSFSVSPETIITVLQYAMEAVETTTLKGVEKKAAVMQLVRKVVIDAPMEDSIERILIEMIDDGIVSHTIDVIVAASRGRLHLNGVANASKIVCTNVAPQLGKCLSSCFPCITSCV